MLVLVVLACGWLCECRAQIVVEDKTNLAQGSQAYLLFYQKAEHPYPKYVSIFDMRVLSGNQGTDTFYPNSSLSITPGQADDGGYTHFGTKTLAANEAGNYSLSYSQTDGIMFESFESTAEPGTVEVRLNEDLPNEYGPYSLYLERRNPGVARLVVPLELVSQPVGETIFAILSPVQWYISVATSIEEFEFGLAVPQELLPGNEVSVQDGDTATVTGNLQSGFVITVGYSEF